MRLRALATPLLALLAAPAPAQDAPAVELDPSALKSEIDASLRWLRSRQSVEDGSYGGAAATAYAVAAFAESPREYRMEDGPFVARAARFLVERQAADGSIADSEADEEERVASTQLAVVAFRALGEPELAPALEKAVGFLGDRRDRIEHVDSFARKLAEKDVDELRDLASTLLERRDEDGSWSGLEGPVLTTAANLLRLAAVHEAWSSRVPDEDGPSEATPLPAFGPADRAKVEVAIERGGRYLVANAIEEGVWGTMGRGDPGVSAMVAAALLAVREPSEAMREAIDAGLDRLLSLQKEDGSIHAGQLANYVTSAAIQALARADREGDRKALARARDFLKELQADEGEGYSTDHHFYGGVGYGGDERPDLSNLQMALEALAASGVPEDDPTFQNALRFLERCQNRSESNDVRLESEGAVVASGDDGGAGYAPGDSKAGFLTLEDGTKVPRSYGSMTYALLKGYLFAGLERDDPRVRAAWEWIREHYTVDVNPGFEHAADPAAAYQGLYYYYLTMARALDLYGQEVVVDAAGVEHRWREELAGRLVAMQRPDGSWINQNSPRWWEGNPVLATAYALLALDTALPAGGASSAGE